MNQQEAAKAMAVPAALAEQIYQNQDTATGELYRNEKEATHANTAAAAVADHGDGGNGSSGSSSSGNAVYMNAPEALPQLDDIAQMLSKAQSAPVRAKNTKYTAAAEVSGSSSVARDDGGSNDDTVTSVRRFKRYSAL